MQSKPEANHGTALPPCAAEFIRRVGRRMWYRRRTRREVQAELTAHFEDALRKCATPQEKERQAQELIAGFGDIKLLATLCHRAKKRCRPLWVKILLRSGQGLGIAIVYYVLCMLPVLLGRPTIRVNYAAWMSDHWRPAQGVENAKVYYDQAATLYVPPPPGLEEKIRLRRWSSVGYSDSEVQLIEQWLTQNQATFDRLRRGASTPHYWPTYDGNEAVPLQMSVVPADLETVQKYRQVVLALKQRIIWETRHGEVTPALDDCLVLRRLGRHLQNRGALNGQMVGIAFEALGYGGIAAILTDANVPPEVLEHVQQELVSSFDFRRQVIDLDCEKAFWYDEVQRNFTDNGRGGGHALRGGFVYAAQNWKESLANTFRFRYPDRRETVALVDRFFQQAQSRLNTPPGASDPGTSNGSLQGPTLSLFFSLVTPVYDSVARQAWRLKTHETATVTLLALQRYFREEGSYPESLDRLVARGYLKDLPRDPFGQGSLTYRRTDEGFLLYSWGADRRDDGDRPGVDNHGERRQWADNGDWVFWPANP